MKQLTKWRKWILGAALLLACAESVALWQNGRGKYLRYVSKPLSDGTRYTFLYPARLTASTQPISNSSSVSVLMWILDPLSEVYLHEPGLSAGCTEIGVQVGSRDPENQAQRDDTKSFYSRLRHLSDVRSRYQFFLQHTNCAQEEQPFEQDDRVLSDSFKILPPGAPVPS